MKDSYCPSTACRCYTLQDAPTIRIGMKLPILSFQLEELLLNYLRSAVVLLKVTYNLSGDGLSALIYILFILICVMSVITSDYSLQELVPVYKGYLPLLLIFLVLVALIGTFLKRK